MVENNALLRELNALSVSNSPDRELQLDNFTPPLPPATIGFEFDMDYGASDIDPPPPSAYYFLEGEKITTHDSAVDGFRLKGDGNRIELGTKPFDVSPAGKKDMTDTVKKISAFTDELQKLCAAASFHPSTNNDDYKKNNRVHGKIVGRPRTFKYSKLVSKVKSIFPVEGESTYYRQKLCNIGASPQATLAIPLAKVDKFIDRIRESESLAKEKFPLSGKSTRRLGLRSDAIYKAQAAVNRSRRYHIRNKTKLGDGTFISEGNYTPKLQGLLILMVSYLFTSELLPGEGDYEKFAKAYLPLNVKNHFRELFKDLSDAEKRVFRERYFDDISQFNIFKLVKKDATLDFAKKTKLFPAKATDWTFYFTAPPTWYDLLKKTCSNIPLKREVEPTEQNPKHKKGDETLFAPISKTIPYIPGSNRVIVEMRRIGTRKIQSGEWPAFMSTLYNIAEEFNK